MVRASVLASSVSWVRIPPEQLFFLFGEKRVVWVSCLPLFSIYRKEFSHTHTHTHTRTHVHTCTYIYHTNTHTHTNMQYLSEQNYMLSQAKKQGFHRYTQLQSHSCCLQPTILMLRTTAVHQKPTVLQAKTQQIAICVLISFTVQNIVS